MADLMVGLDPEFLAVAGDRIVPAEKFLPAPIRTGGKLNAYSYDNACAELRPDPHAIPGVVVGRMRSLMFTVRMRISSAKDSGAVPPNTDISLSPSGQLSDEDRGLKSVAEFGCSPSMNVMEDLRTSVTMPNCTADTTPFRSAGFHIHHGVTDAASTQIMVAILDVLLGLYDVTMCHHLAHDEASRIRRQEVGYGRAGEYRQRVVASGDVVLEYRVMSPWMLASDDSVRLIKIMSQICTLPLDKLMDLLSSMPPRPAVMDAINHTQPEIASDLWENAMKVWQQKILHYTGVKA